MKKFLLLITILIITIGCSKKIDYDVSITLEGNPSTGYDWIVKNTDESNFKLVDTIIKTTDEELVGAPSTYTFYFKAKGQSIADVTFEYSRPNESIDATYLIKYTFSIDAKKKVTLIDSTGSYNGVIPSPEIKE